MAGALQALARSYHNNRQSIPGDCGRCPDSVSSYKPAVDSESGALVSQARVITHPGLPQVEGQGQYTYPYNPSITKNFIFAPARKVDSTVLRTLDSNILVAKPQVDEDVVISEIWVGGGQELSTLTEMARVFDTMWKTALPKGRTLGWEPLDVGVGRYNVRIVSVQIGGVDYEYNEVREFAEQTDPSYLRAQLTLQLKPESPVLPPTGEVSIEGL